MSDGFNVRNSVTGREILELCDDHSEARNRILDDRTSGVTVIATVGATGQGKSWITRQLIGNQDAKKLIRSGNNSDEATEQLTWVGPSPPENLDTGSEKYIRCASSEMEPIGTPYLVVDAPGATDDRRSIAGIAHRALSMASVMLLVVRADQMRSDSIGALAAASEGTIVIPVINAARSQQRIRAEVEALLAGSKSCATSTISRRSPLMTLKFQISQRIQSEKKQQRKLPPDQKAGQAGWSGDRRRSTRLAAIDSRFQQHCTHSEKRIAGSDGCGATPQHGAKSPGEIAETLVDETDAAVRSPFTPPLSAYGNTCDLFSYRTFYPF